MRLAELVAEKIEDEKSQGQEKCGKEDAPPRGLDRIEEGGSIGQELSLIHISEPTRPY